MKGFPRGTGILSAVCSLLMVLSACATTGPDTLTSKKDPMAVYTHGSPSFTVKYPGNWIKRPLNDLEVLSVARSMSAKSLPSMKVYVFDVPKGVKLADTPEWMAKRLQEDMPWMKKFTSSSTDIWLNDDTRAIATTYFWKYLESLPFFGAQMATIKENKLVIVLALDVKNGNAINNLKQYVGSLEFSTTETTDAFPVYRKMDHVGESDQRSEVNKDKRTNQMPESSGIIRLTVFGISSDDVLELEKEIERQEEAGSGHREEKVPLEHIQLSEMVEDVEALQKYEPENVSDLPETGVVFKNNTDRIITLKIKGTNESILTVSDGDSSAAALSAGTYRYSFWTKSDKELKHLSGEKTICEKCRCCFKLYIKRYSWEKKKKSLWKRVLQGNN